jgi:hypothetical protein
MTARMHITRRTPAAAAGNGVLSAVAFKCRVLAVPGS